MASKILQRYGSRETFPVPEETHNGSTSRLDDEISISVGGSFDGMTGITGDGQRLNDQYGEINSIFVCSRNGTYKLGSVTLWKRGDLAIKTNKGWSRLPIGEELLPQGTPVVNQINVATATTLPPDQVYVGMLISDPDTNKAYFLSQTPYTDPNNWAPLSTGNYVDSFRAAPGNFDPTIGAQYCNSNQNISSSSIEAGVVYKIIASSLIYITFDLPIIGSSPLLIGNTWGLQSGDKLVFYKTSDNSFYDVSVE